MSYRFRRVDLPLLKASAPREKLIQNGDVYTLSEQDRIVRDGYSSSNKLLINSIDLLFSSTFELRDQIKKARGKVITADPLFFVVEEGSKSDCNSSSAEKQNSDRYINMHFYGDRRDMLNVRKDLSTMAWKLCKYREKLPDIMVGTSHHDATRRSMEQVGSFTQTDPTVVTSRMYSNLAKYWPKVKPGKSR